MTFQLGDRRYEVSAGSFAMLPWRNVTMDAADPARCEEPPGGWTAPREATPPAGWAAHATCGALTPQGVRCLRDPARQDPDRTPGTSLCSYHARLARRAAVALDPSDAGSNGGTHRHGESAYGGAARGLCEAMTAAGERCRGLASYAVAIDAAPPRRMCGHHAKLSRRGAAVLVAMPSPEDRRVLAGERDEPHTP